MNWFRCSVRKASKRYACALCDREIVRGQNYYDGSSKRAHVNCVPGAPRDDTSPLDWSVGVVRTGANSWPCQLCGERLTNGFLAVAGRDEFGVHFECSQKWLRVHKRRGVKG